MDEPDHKAELEMADRHIREAEAHITRQREIVTQLRQDGHSAACNRGEALLAIFEQTMASHLDHRALIIREIEGRIGPWNNQP
jgi:hypothetical protein